MADSEHENPLTPEVMTDGDDIPMPEVLTDEDREYFEPFECPAELDVYGPLTKPSSPIENVEAEKAYRAAFGKRGTEPGIEALSEALHIRDEREKNQDRSDWNDFTGYLDSVRKEINCRVVASKHQVFEVGKLIYDAKTFVSEWGRNNSERGQIRARGYFSKWLDNHFPLSRSTALNCVRTYKACLGHEESVQFFSASTLYLMSEPRFPKNITQYLLENVNNDFKGKRAEIIDVVNKLQSGQIEYDGPEMRQMLRNNVEYTVAGHVLKELEKLEKALEVSKKALEDRQDKSVAKPLLPIEESGKGHPLYEETIQLVQGLIATVQEKRKALELAEGLA